MKKPIAVLALALLGTAHAGDHEPIIDMHLHSGSAADNGPPPMAMCLPLIPNMPLWDPATEDWGDVFMRWSKEPPCDDPIWSSATDQLLIQETAAAMRAHNVIGVLSGNPATIDPWLDAAPDRFIPSIQMRIGRDDLLAPEAMRVHFESGKFRVLGEIANQYSGIAPNDPRMDPYWALVEELDIPAAIHLGSGPPGAPYLGFPDMRIGDGSALLLEDVLIRYPGLRLSIMHYGHQQLADTLALMEHHPQVYLDLGGIQWYYERAYFWRQLRTLIDAGFGKRIMFGSDQMVWPGLIAESIEIVERAPFLSADQKRDIFYNNAARFLRLSAEEIARHHGR